MGFGTWLSPGPLQADSLAELRSWLAQLAGDVSLVALDHLEVAGVSIDPFAVAAGLSSATGLPALGVATGVHAGRLPTIIGRELIALDHVSSGRTGLVLRGDGPALAESARIVAAMLRGGEVAGGASSAMPADFAFENRPGPVTPAGPTVIVLDAESGATVIEGAGVPMVAVSDEVLRSGDLGLGEVVDDCLVVRQTTHDAAASPLRL